MFRYPSRMKLPQACEALTSLLTKNLITICNGTRYVVLCGVAGFLAGCKCAPPQMLLRADSPSGNQSLIYEMDTCTRPNGSPTFDVSISSNGSRPRRVFETNNSNHHLKLTWLSEHEALIDCRECDLSGSDVHFFRSSSEGVVVRFAGVPLDERHRRD